MTVPTITDDLIKEIESEYIGSRSRLSSTVISCGTLANLIARIRQLEKDAARYRDMLIKAGRWVPMSDDSCHCEDCAEQSELVAAIDEAMQEDA